MHVQLTVHSLQSTVQSVYSIINLQSNQSTAPPEQHIVGLDVAVHDAVVVQVAHAGAVGVGGEEGVEGRRRAG